jgi:hypothetical protein
MQDNAENELYRYLSIHSGISPQADEEISVADQPEPGDKYCYYFGFNYFNVGEFRKWYYKYEPQVIAGWVSTYDKWRIEKGKWHPAPEDLSKFMLENVERDDQYFIECTNYYDPASMLMNILIEQKVSDEADLTYYFDN